MLGEREGSGVVRAYPVSAFCVSGKKTVRAAALATLGELGSTKAVGD